jgi:transcriptional regulator with XRE-family HTH domain
VSLLAETIKVRRSARGMDQAGLAAKVGVGQQTVSRWETGLAAPRRENVVALADALDMDAGMMYRLAGYLPPEELSAIAPAFTTIYGRMAELSDQELLLLLDRAWEEHRRRLGMNAPIDD